MFKKILIPVLPLFLFMLVASCQQQDNKNDNDEGVSPDLVSNPITAEGEKEKVKLPVMEFETTSHDFGTIVQGEKVAHTFKFKNIGGTDLIISDASATCGCTVPEYDRKPIKPGDEGKIEVVFNSAGRTGSQHKTVNVLTNAQPNTIRLEINAEIIVVK
jgi:hypothetical protein